MKIYEVAYQEQWVRFGEDTFIRTPIVEGINEALNFQGTYIVEANNDR